MKRLSLLGCLTAGFLAAGTQLHAQTANVLPPGEGRDLLATACSQCHALSIITAMREGQAGWKRHVYNMVLRGTQLTAAEAETVIRYLATNFGPGSQQPAAANAAAVVLPSGTGKQLVETHCSTCHDLERVTALKRQKRDWEATVAKERSRGTE